MALFTRIVFLLFFLFACTETSVKRPPNVPWLTARAAERFLRAFVRAMAESSELQRQEISDLESVPESILAIMRRTSGKLSVAKIQALNMAFASVIASIVSAEGSGSTKEKAAVTRKALIRAFRETTGSVNTALVKEIINMIKLFSGNQKDNEIDYSLSECPESRVQDEKIEENEIQVDASAGNEATSTAEEASQSSSTVSASQSFTQPASEVSQRTSATSEASSIFAEHLLSVLEKSEAFRFQTALIFSVADNAYTSTLAEDIANATGSNDIALDVASEISQIATGISWAEENDVHSAISVFASAVARVLSNYNLLSLDNASELASKIANSLLTIASSEKSATTLANNENTTSGVSSTTAASASSDTSAAPSEEFSPSYDLTLNAEISSYNDEFSETEIKGSAVASTPSITAETTVQSSASPLEFASPSEGFPAFATFPWSNQPNLFKLAPSSPAVASASPATTATAKQSAESTGYAASFAHPPAPSQGFSPTFHYPVNNEHDFYKPAPSRPAIASASSATSAAATQGAVSTGSDESFAHPTAPSQDFSPVHHYPLSNEKDFFNTALTRSSASSASSAAASSKQTSKLVTDRAEANAFASSGISGLGYYGLSTDRERPFLLAPEGVNGPGSHTSISTLYGPRFTNHVPYSSLMENVLWSSSGLTSPAAEQRISSLMPLLVSAVNENNFSAPVFESVVSPLFARISQTTTLPPTEAFIETLLELISGLLSIMSSSELGVVSTAPLSEIRSAIAQSINFLKA